MKGFLAALLLSAPMMASAYTWTDVIDFNPNPKITSSSSHSYTHDITDNGFNPAVDTAIDYDLTIHLADAGRQWFDVVYIDQPGSWLSDGYGLFANWSFASVTTEASYAGLLKLNADGTLDVTVNGLLGSSFYLDASELVVTGNKATATSVPEPTSLALLAAGMIGIVLMRRLTARNN